MGNPGSMLSPSPQSSPPPTSSRRPRLSASPLLPRLAALGLCAALGVGCGDDASPITPDAAVDAPVTPTLITLRTSIQPLLLTFHEVGHPWQQLPTQADASVEISVTGPYEVVVVCPRELNARIRASRHARVPADGAVLEGLCPSSPRLLVQGILLQPGALSVGNTSSFSEFPNWDFSFAVKPGTYDLALGSRPADVIDAIAFRRGLEVAGNLDLGSIDLTQEQLHPTVLVPFTATNLLPGEFRAARLRVTTSHGPIAIDGGASLQDPWRVPIAPAAALLPGERQVVALTTVLSPYPLPTLSRTLHVAVDGPAPVEVTLPDNLADVTLQGDLEELSATVPGRSAYDQLRLARGSNDPVTPSGTSHDITLSAAFLAATQPPRLELQFRDVPGFLDDWYDNGPGGFLQRISLQATKGQQGEPGSILLTWGELGLRASAHL